MSQGQNKLWLTEIGKHNILGVGATLKDSAPGRGHFIQGWNRKAEDEEFMQGKDRLADL